MLLLIRGLICITIILNSLVDSQAAFGLQNCSTEDSNVFHRFLSDPISNFDRIKAIPNLCDRLLGYELEQVRQGIKAPGQGFLDALFLYNFQEVDERKIEIVIYLYKQLRRCYSEIVEKTNSTFCLQPAMFVRMLEKESDWRDVVNGLSSKWRSFSPGIGRLGDSEFEREVKEYALLLHAEREHKMKLVGVFLNEPVKNFDKIKSWNDICVWISRYEDQLHEDEGSSESAMDRFIETQFQEIDEDKTKILVFLVLNCQGANGELLADKAAKVFSQYTGLFIRVLSETNEWKTVVDEISMLGWGDFSKGLAKLGDTSFEREIKKYVWDRIKRDEELEGRHSRVSCFTEF